MPASAYCLTIEAHATMKLSYPENIQGLANISQDLEEFINKGNLDALRGWGHAKNYVHMQWMLLQQDQAEDYVIASGLQYSVHQFIRWSAQELRMTVRFEGKGIDEVTVV